MLARIITLIIMTVRVQFTFLHYKKLAKSHAFCLKLINFKWRYLGEFALNAKIIYYQDVSTV